ncbi:DUF4174 domain-containing protein [Tunicatimonas pelagia]|uniref:DUF4174 domain-containing protein n=1 Tax=Tunicatimonas pelagia TaxID=931531 RepID=UPI002666E407|nr:DUF4174 domain-containing protein [Tunicatimonas pelagia]WKN44304.1 DUF4174 domain-containing protein [Tunicatimonas pelagia]
MKLATQDVSVLDQYRWENRILLLFADTEESVIYKDQLQTLEREKSEMDDRDLLVFKVFPQKVITPEGKVMGEEIATQLRQKYRTQNNTYAVVLIGKDGGQKLNQSSLLSTEKLFGIIDQMPMRRREMKDKSD